MTWVLRYAGDASWSGGLNREVFTDRGKLDERVAVLVTEGRAVVVTPLHKESSTPVQAWGKGALRIGPAAGARFPLITPRASAERATQPSASCERLAGSLLACLMGDECSAAQKCLYPEACIERRSERKDE